MTIHRTKKGFKFIDVFCGVGLYSPVAPYHQAMDTYKVFLDGPIDVLVHEVHHLSRHITKSEVDAKSNVSTVFFQNTNICNCSSWCERRRL